jgi:hypothetical protein
MYSTMQNWLQIFCNAENDIKMFEFLILNAMNRDIIVV